MQGSTGSQQPGIIPVRIRLKAFGTICRPWCEFSVAHGSLSDAKQHVAVSEHKKMTDLLLQPLALFSKEFSVEHQKVLPAEMTSVYHAIK